jgi:UDP-N-acetylmuramoyl-L-alanyl-D-glutamate--2,6-diaminopimelate ligase
MELTAVRSHWELIFSDEIGGGSASLSSPLLGAFNVSNVTAALGLALGLGYDRATLLAAVETLRPVPGRMESIALGNGAAAVVDYAHTPDALDNVLTSLRRITGGRGTITVVFGCGGDRDRAKRPMMGAIARRLADRVIVTSDNPRSEEPARIIEDIVAGIEDRSGAEMIVDRRAAIERALDGSEAGDLVVIAGKGHEDYQIIGGVRHHFDDREVVHGWVAARQAGEPEGVVVE